MTGEPAWRSPLPPGFRWPDGIRAAACITFDVDAENPILFEHSHGQAGNGAPNRELTFETGQNR
jgi:hypothetical protein